MKLSIIIPMYNSQSYIGNCLDSLLNQNLNETDYEIIIVDDGSTDNGKKIVNAYISKHKHISIYEQNSGTGAARNLGIEVAKGEYLYFIDSDDYLAFNMLHIPLKILEKEDLELIAFKSLPTYIKNSYQSIDCETIENSDITTGVEFCSKSDNFLVFVWWYLIKREFLIRTGIKFTEEGRFFQDNIFTFSLFFEIKKIKFLDLDVHRYFKRQASTMNNLTNSHLQKWFDDCIYTTRELNLFKEEILSKRKSSINGFIERVDYWSDNNKYFMFTKFTKTNISIKKINSILNYLKSIDEYPIGDNYFNTKMPNSIKAIIASTITNNKYLFYLLLYPLRLAYKLKLSRFINKLLPYFILIVSLKYIEIFF